MRIRFAGLLVAMAMVLFGSSPAPAQDHSTGGPYTVDANTLLLLHFDGSYVGAQGQVPSNAIGSFELGRFGQGVNATPQDYSWLEYPAAGNIDWQAGTLEFWVKPNWNGNDNAQHTLFSAYGSFRNNHLVICKDGANNLRFLFWDGSGVEYGIFATTSSWVAGEWHYIAVTWEATQIALYVDFELQQSLAVALPQMTFQTLNFSHSVGDQTPPWGWGPNAVVDEFRISNIVRSFEASPPSGIPASEHNALVAIYNSTEGPHWNWSANWLGPAGTECTWAGITCNADGTHVTRVHLSWNNLTGRLPEAIGDLTELEFFAVDYNPLLGPIPAAIRYWTKIKFISFGATFMTGAFPGDPWPYLPELETLYLQIALSGPIPESFGSLTKLKSFSIHGASGITGQLPESMKNLTALELLDLGGAGGITGPVPAWLGDFTNLRTLGLEVNQFSGDIPSELGRLHNLEYLSLGNNALDGDLYNADGQTTWLDGLPNLKAFGAANNRLTGTIPAAFGAMIQLESLDLRGNQFLSGTIPPVLGGLSNLQYLWLNFNQLTGPIPPELGGLSKLKYLELSGNGLSGGIPWELGSLADLEFLNLAGNPLGGTIPPELGNLRKLRYLGLYYDQLEGELPASLGGLGELRTLWVEANQMSGQIPPELGNLTNLEDLRLPGNGFEGSIPATLGNLSKLGSLILWRNHLSGPIPASLGNLSNLQALHLCGNMLSGPLPFELTRLVNLQPTWLLLDYNALFTDDPVLREFLNTKQSGGDWERTQTVAPTNVAIGTVTQDSVEVTWTPIRYTWNGGGYRVLVGTSPGGPYSLAGTTADKRADRLTVGGLPFGPLYFFVVQTVTYPHGDNPNTVESEYSAEVAAQTLPPPSTVTINDVAVTEGNEGMGIAQFFVTLSEPATQQVTVSFVTGDLTATAGSDYLPVSGELSFNPGEIAKTVDVPVIGDIVQEPDETFVVMLTGASNADITKPEGRCAIVNDDVNIPLSERDALIAIYNSTIGPNWLRRDNWRNADDTDFNAPGTECTWFTVTCNAEQSHVVSVWLGWNNPAGVLPPEVAYLTELQAFVTAPGAMSGQVPLTFATLSKMRYLDLNWNAYTGDIAPILQGMPLLEDLRLLNNHFSGEVLPTILGCSRLRILLLSGNEFTGEIPPQLGDLQNLESLALGFNRFSGRVPDTLGRLARLQGLELYNNEFIGTLPEQLGQLTALTGLSLGNNRLLDAGPVPAWAAGLTNLTYLDLRDMNLTGPIPAFLGNLTHLRNLYLQQNHLTAPLPAELGSLANLYSFFVGGNALVGAIPTSFLNLVTLTESDLTYNGLHADDPDLAALLARTQCCNWDWTLFQTVPPTDVSATAVGPDSVQVSWTPIPYTGDTGGYRVFHRTSPGEPYTLYGMTSDKTAASMLVSGLAPGVQHLFVVQSVTLPHASNSNTVESEYSAEVSAAMSWPLPALAIDDAGVIEGNSGTTTVRLQVNLSEPYPEIVTVDYVTEDGTALVGLDYLPASGTLVFNPGELSAPIDVQVIGDLLEEPSETFIVFLHNVAGATIARSPGMVTIVNDDVNIPASERDALIALYDSTNGPHWNNRTNWRNADDTDFNAPGTECTWAGIGCNADQTHVTAINLWWNNMTGNLATNWGLWIPSLAHLEIFSVYANAVTGAIPKEFGALSALRELTFDFNQFDGQVPMELCSSRSVQRLALGFNKLSGPIPECLGDMTQLIALETFNNEFTGNLPDSLGNLTSLQFLSLGNNLLLDDDAVPTWLAGLTAVKYLDLRAMNLTGTVPVFLTGMHNLENLYLSGNKLTGVIPPEFGGMIGLKELYLDWNRLTRGIPLELGNMTAIRVLSLGDNPLGGTIPETLGQLSELYALGVVNANLEGPIPESFGNLKKLWGISLFGNHLSGPIPASLGGASSLELIWLYANDLEGPLPPELGQLSKLRTLHLGDNRLTGRLPAELGNLTNLYQLQLGGNAFTGPVPSSLLNLTGLWDGWSRLSFNALHTDNPALAAFLDRIECCGWHFTQYQTIPPADVMVTRVGTDSVQLAWTPIEFTGGNGGGYRVFYSTSPGGPYTLFGITQDKTVSSMLVTGLADGVTYFFVVQSVTFPGWFNQNTVESEYSAEVSATTIPLNQPPTVEAGGELAGIEGHPVAFVAEFSDPDPETHGAVIDWGDGTVEPGVVAESGGSGTVSGTHAYVENGPYTATVTVYDTQGGSGADTAPVTVANAAPVVGAITAPLDPVQLGSAVSAAAAFIDAGILDTHVASWAWGDGSSTSGTIVESNGAGTATGTHVYAQAGVYTLTLTVTDDDGGAGVAQFRYVVIYDPSAGFVTGGGWITSPLGAYVVDPTMTGKANFGFESKYKKGDKIPTGTTEFQFHAAALNFHSSTYEWLVVAGAKAQYKGTGTINGAGSYGFMLTAIDGQIAGGGGQDKFRIKIWDKATNQPVYDNLLQAPDDADPTTVIGGGSIVIHKEK